jgi:hypothetical protein
MRSSCRRHQFVTAAAVLMWVVVGVFAFGIQPAADDYLRLPFVVFLCAAMSTSVLAGLPWMLRGFVRDQTLAYVAGYMHREADEPQEEERRLTVVR